MSEEVWRDERKRLLGILQDYELRQIAGLLADEGGELMLDTPEERIGAIKRRIAELDEKLKRSA